MATAYEADITDLVKPYMDKARKEGEFKSIYLGVKSITCFFLTLN
jgi:hypothetical protein